MKEISSGIEYFHRQDYVEAFKVLMPIAKAGHPESQGIIASIYHLGLGKEKNLPEAIKWYKASAKQGYGVASNNLSELYRFGEGVERNLEAADYWREKAISQGFQHVREKQD